MIRVKEDLLFVNWNKHLVESGDYTQQEVSDDYSGINVPLVQNSEHDHPVSRLKIQCFFGV